MFSKNFRILGPIGMEFLNNKCAQLFNEKENYASDNKMRKYTRIQNEVSKKKTFIMQMNLRKKLFLNFNFNSKVQRLEMNHKFFNFCMVVLSDYKCTKSQNERKLVQKMDCKI
jgi:hypothetical protein